MASSFIVMPFLISNWTKKSLSRVMRMNLFLMYSQSSRLSKSSSTIRTFIRFFTSMNHKMSFDGTGSGKCHFTKRTLVRLPCCIPSLQNDWCATYQGFFMPMLLCQFIIFSIWNLFISAFFLCFIYSMLNNIWVFQKILLSIFNYM